MADVVYVYDPEVGNFHYGPKHPMKPHRIAITHSLVHSYGLDKLLKVVQPKVPLNDQAFLETYHTKDYIASLDKDSNTEDCPCFPGIREYFMRYTYGTLTAVHFLNHSDAQIAINWSGGLHHAKKAEASGFCYINDIVIGILELLKHHARVLYIDIDIHHGDGVEEAFYDRSEVMTLSFHRFGDHFFPGTGELFCNGTGKGKGYAINVPLLEGIDDHAFIYIFKRVVEACCAFFDPTAIVMQCGADSLAGDKIGCFNLSIYGHGECLNYVKSLNKKMLVLGGGGYTPRNVARLWTYETSILVGAFLPIEIPKSTPYYEFFAPDYQLHPPIIKRFDNMNTREYLDTVIEYIVLLFEQHKRSDA